MANLTGSMWEALKTALVASLGEGKHGVILGEGNIWLFRDIPFSQPLLCVRSALLYPSEMEEMMMQRKMMGEKDLVVIRAGGTIAQCPAGVQLLVALMMKTVFTKES